MKKKIMIPALQNLPSPLFAKEGDCKNNSPFGKGFMPFRVGLRGILGFGLLFHFFILCGLSAAGVPTVSMTEVTDVTPRSFSVTWTSSEPATGGINIYQADCATQITGLPVTSASNDSTGNTKVTVSGLTADTSYCYQAVAISKSTSETTVYPAQPATVSTAKAVTRSMVVDGVSVPFANDILKTPPVYLKSEMDTKEGVLSVLYLLDGKGQGPVSLINSSDEGKNFFNMNNLFDPATSTSLNLAGGERVKITERHGLTDCNIERFRWVPADLEATKAGEFAASARRQDVDANDAVNILDILRVAKGNNSAQGDNCFNNDLDLNGDGLVDASDIDDAIGGFDARP